jgi:hypothetical protein
VEKLASNPLDLFSFFFPRHLFRTMANESNRYAASTVVQRAVKVHTKQKTEVAQKKRPKDALETRKQIRTRLRSSFRAIQPVEYAQMFGILIARMLSPHKRRLSYHWGVSAYGLLPAGTFGSVMNKNR